MPSAVKCGVSLFLSCLVGAGLFDALYSNEIGTFIAFSSKVIQFLFGFAFLTLYFVYLTK